MKLSRVDTGCSARVRALGVAVRPVRWTNVLCPPSTVVEGSRVSAASLDVERPRYQEIPAFGTARADMSAGGSGGIPARRGPV